MGRIASGDRIRVRAAASSIASGSPSSREQIAATGLALSPPTAKSARIARALSSKSRIAAKSTMSSAAAGRRRKLERGHLELLLALQVQRYPARRQDVQPGAGGEQPRDVERGLGDVLEVVEHEQRVLRDEVRREALDERPRGTLLHAELGRDRADDETRLGERRQLDEDDAVLEVVRGVPRRPQGEPRLAGAAGPGQRHETSLRITQERGQTLELLLPSDERGRLRRQVVRARGDRGPVERGVLLQDRALQLLERGRRLDPQLLDEHASRVLVRRERVRLPAGAVEHAHLERAEGLAQRLLVDERLDLCGEAPVSTEIEIGGDALLERRQAQVEQTRRGRTGEGLVEVGQRRAAPESQGLGEQARRPARVAVGSRDATLGHEALELAEVEEVLVAEVEAVAAADLLHPERRQRPLQPPDEDVQGLERRLGRRVPPELVDEPLGRHDPPRVQEQHGEKRALLAGEAMHALAVEHLERAQQTQLHDGLLLLGTTVPLVVEVLPPCFPERRTIGAHTSCIPKEVTR